MIESTFSFLDYLVVFGYLAISVGLGISLRRQSSREEFLTAGRSMGKITVGLSVMATLFSANSFVMYPSTTYSNSLRIFMALIAFWAVGPVVMWVFIPVYARLNCNTAYEYLEKRFHVSVRCLASALFIMLRISWMAAATYAASVGISAISGVHQVAVTVGLGIVAIFYTMLGGLRAVMWTDVLQFFVFFGTILLAAILLVQHSDGGTSEIVNTYFEGRDNLWIDFSWDVTLQFGTWAILIGSFVEGLSAFGADQVAVQRYIAAKDEKTSQTAMLVNLCGMAIILPGLMLIGVGLFSYFHHHPDDLTPVVIAKLKEDSQKGDAKLEGGLAAAIKAKDSDAAIAKHFRDNPRDLHKQMVRLKLNDKAMPQFVVTKFPPGIIGLLVAALMAATMSSIDSGIHSVTTALIVDFRDRLYPHWRPESDQKEMVVARLLVLIIGAISITMALFVGQLGDVFTVAKKSVGCFAAPLLAVFVVGLFIPSSNTRGVFIGTWIGAGATLFITYQYTKWYSMWLFPVGFVISVTLSWVLSLALGGARKEEEPLTYWQVMRKSSKP